MKIVGSLLLTGHTNVQKTEFWLKCAIEGELANLMKEFGGFVPTSWTVKNTLK
jgi:hypothetical protein